MTSKNVETLIEKTSVLTMRCETKDLLVVHGVHMVRRGDKDGTVSCVVLAAGWVGSLGPRTRGILCRGSA